MPSSVQGACACRRVRFELDLPTKFVAHCHCENCRRAHGAGVVTFAGVPETQFRVLEGRDAVARWSSELGSTRSFCSGCGSTLLYRGPRWPGEVHVVVANLDGELDRLPSGHAHADEAPPWLPVLDDLPHY